MVISELVGERRKLVNQIAGTEAKLNRLRSRLNLVEVKLVCFGHDLEKLRKTRKPERLFKGRSIIRRIADVERAAGRRMMAKELADVLASQDGLKLSPWDGRAPGRARITDALKRARRDRSGQKNIARAT